MNDKTYTRSGDCVIDCDTEEIFVLKQSLDRLLREQISNILKEIEHFSSTYWDKDGDMTKIEFRLSGNKWNRLKKKYLTQKGGSAKK